METDKYLPPAYDDDDEDDFDDDDFDEIDEDGEDEATENYLDNSQKSNTMSMPFNTSQQQSVWGTSGNQGTGSIWGSNNNSGNSFFGQSNNQPAWGNSGNTWRPSSGPTWGSGSGSNIWNGVGGEKKSIDRTKRIIFCDVLDCLVETYQSNGKPGLLPRGIYDIKFRFDVWDRLACFNPEKIFAMVPRALINSSNNASWRSFLEYTVCSLSEYLRTPYQVCQILLQTEIGQPKEDMMMKVLGGLDKTSIIQIGVNSGLYGQNNRDQIASMKCGIDYIDLATFMNSYY